MKLIKFFFNLLDTSSLTYATDPVEPPVIYAEENSNVGINTEKLGFIKKKNAENFVTNEKKDPPSPPTPTPEEIAAAAEAERVAALTPEVTEVTLAKDEKLTKEKAIELTKNLKDEDEVDVDDKKMTKKELLATFEASPPPPTEFKIGEKVYTEAEYKVVVDEFLTKNKLAPDYLEKTAPELLAEQLRIHLNLKEGSKSINERNQVLARQKEDLLSKGQQVETMFKSAQDKLTELELEKTENAKKIITDAEIEALEYDAQLAAKLDKGIAERENQRIDREKLEQNKILQNAKDIAVRNAFNLAFTVIQTEIPELGLDKHVLQIIRDDKEGIELDEAKITKAYAVYELANDIMREVNQRKMTEPLESFVVKYYNRFKYKYGNFESAAQPAKDNRVNPPINKDAIIKAHILKIKTSQLQNAPPLHDSSSDVNKINPKNFDTLERNREKMIEKVYGKGGVDAYPKF